MTIKCIRKKRLLQGRNQGPINLDMLHVFAYDLTIHSIDTPCVLKKRLKIQKEVL